MSAPESSDLIAGLHHPPSTPAGYTRWPGLLLLCLCVLLGPAVALANEQWTYAVDTWTCGQGTHWTIHIVPILCLAVAIGCGVAAHRHWRVVGPTTDDDADTVPARTRFLALLGIGASALSALVILAQWAAVWVFGPCMRG